MKAVPAGEVLIGLELRELPPGFIPTSAALIIKGLDEDGNVAYLSRWTPDMHTIDAVGAFIVAADLARHDALGMYESDDE